jgi:hypothetical protein
VLVEKHRDLFEDVDLKIVEANKRAINKTADGQKPTQWLPG